jgi:hypothetical protein
MKLTVQVVVHADEGAEAVVREVFTLQREESLALDALGLRLGEGCSQDTDRSRHQPILKGDFRCSGGYGLSVLGFDCGLNHESRHLIRAAEIHSMIH